MMKFAVLLSLSLGISAASLAAEPKDKKSAEKDRPIVRLWQGVVGLRNKCAIEGVSGWNAYLTPEARKRLDTLNRQIWEDEADGGWSYFFGRALFEIGRPSSSAPVVGFYHPWGDVWLLTEWQTTPEAKITNIEVVSGEWLRRRGEPPMDPRPDWLRREGYRVEQLARAAIANVAEFDRIMGGKSPWREALRLDRQQQQLNEFDLPTAATQLLDAWLRADELKLGADAFDKTHPPPAVLTRLVESSVRFQKAGCEGNVGFFVDLATATNPDTATQLRQLSPKAFATLVPAYWLADQDWAQAFLVPDHNPDFCLALSYKQVDKRLQLTRIDLVHFPSIAKALEAGATE